jgi:hypothetical protein
MSDDTVSWKDLRKKADDATKPPEPGWYTLECTKAEGAKAATSGKPMIKAQFKIVDGPAAGKTGIFNNFNITTDNDFAMSIFFRHMAAFGLDENFFNTDPSVDAVASALVGRRASVQLGQRPYQGQMRPQFEDVKKLDGFIQPGVVMGGPSVPGPGNAGIATTPSVPTVPTTPVVTTPTTPSTSEGSLPTAPPLPAF